MKKYHFYFVAECLVIVALLIVIGILIQGDDRALEKSPVSEEVVEKLVEEKKNVTTVVSIPRQEDSGIKEEKKNKPVADKDTKEPEKMNEPTEKEEKSVREEEQKKIVVFGDSIWNAERGENGISEQVMEATGVKIYNCAIGGTTAAVVDEPTIRDEWTSKSFNGMMYIAKGSVPAENLILEDAAYGVIKEVDFNEVDYVIISYGLNDYFSDVPIFPKEYYDMTSFVGALRHGIQKLKEKYPEMKFILTSPTYCGWFQGERQFRLDDYVEAARSVAAEYDTYFLDMFHALGKSPEEKSQYLEDGVHLTDEGLTLYAKCVTEFLRGLE